MADNRVLHLDLYDYSGNKICPIYDNYTPVLGEAVNVYIQDERNGWRELYFDMPTVIQSEEGNLENFRIDLLKAEYLIEATETKGKDWFFISEPKIVHNAFNKSLSITAPHVSQWLKYKNLGMEFSDNEGNNIGTAEELLRTILEGTGWKVGNVYPFAEKDGSTKYRSLKASAKTGAFKLITSMCELFDARPVFHGDTREIDIVPLNPFSEVAPGEVPAYAKENGVIELNYGSSLKNVTRVINTDNIVTKLYAYGAYGDKTYGYCAIDECVHTEYIFTTNQRLESGHEYFFEVNDTSGTLTSFSFTVTEDLEAGETLVYSLLDPCSMSYIWREPDGKAYFVKQGKRGEQLDASIEIKEEVPNWFGFLLDFNYYITIGLFDDEMLQQVAKYQREAPALYEKISQASLAMSDAVTELSKTAGVFPYCKLAVKEKLDGFADGYLTLRLDYENYDQGVIYRTDYDSTKDTYFKWVVTDEVDPKGDPINTGCSRLYIMHPADASKPITWDVLCLKKVYDDLVNPKAITLWANENDIKIDLEKDQFFLLQSLSTAGYLGYLESRDEAAVESLDDATTIATNTHKVIFTDQDPHYVQTPGGQDPFPGLDVETFEWMKVNSYGWLWRYYPVEHNGVFTESDFYFCNKAYDTEDGKVTWKRVAFTDKMPTDARADYWYNWRTNTLSRSNGTVWNSLDSYADENIASYFGTVYYFGKIRDMLYQGVKRKQIYTLGEDSSLTEKVIPAGNYYFENGYGSFWAFTLDEPVEGSDSSITYDVYNNWITVTRNGVDESIKGKTYRFDGVKYHPSDIITVRDATPGLIDITNGNVYDEYDASVYTNCKYNDVYLPVLPDTTYKFSKLVYNTYILYYNDKKRWISAGPASSTYFTTPANCFYIRLLGYGLSGAVNTSSLIDEFEEGYSGERTTISVAQPFGSELIGTCDNTIILSDMTYLKLNITSTDGETIGLLACMQKFVDDSNYIYTDLYANLKSAQDAVKELENALTDKCGDIYREGYWQDSSYVDGDEKKLYEDAWENLEEIAKPETTYNISFLDLYTSNDENKDYGNTEQSAAISWPDIDISSAVHLIDPELDINCWAYVDKIKKCYDKPWLTTLAINTKLSTIGQHTFTDVMTHIADVASEMKGKASKYDNAANKAIAALNMNLTGTNVSITEQALTSVYNKMDVIDNKLISHESSITQTAEEITTEVARSIESDRQLTTRIKQTADSIRTDLFGKNGSGSIIQNADEFSSVYQNNYNAAKDNRQLLTRAQELNQNRITDVLTEAITLNNARIYSIIENARQLNSQRDENGALLSEDEDTLLNILTTFKEHGLILPEIIEGYDTFETIVDSEETVENVLDNIDGNIWLDDTSATRLAEILLQFQTRGLIDSNIAVADLVTDRVLITNILNSIDGNTFTIEADREELIDIFEQLQTKEYVDQSIVVETLVDSSAAVTNTLENIPVSREENLMSDLKQTMYGLYLSIYGTDSTGHIITSADEFRSVFASADAQKQTEMTQTLYGITNIVESKEGKSLITQDDRSIMAQVRSANADPNGGNAFNTSSINITDNNIHVSSTGSINIDAGGKFTVDSDNFDVDENGIMTTNEAVLTNATVVGNIYKNGYPVLAMGDDIVVSTTEPAGVAGRIWIKPGTGGGGGGSTTPATTGTATFTGSYSFSIRSYDNLHNFSTSLSGNGFPSDSTNCTYNVRFNFFMPSSEGKQKPGGGKIRVVLGNYIAEETGLYTGSGNKSVNLTFNSGTWVANSKSLAFTIQVIGVSGYNGTYLNNASSSSITVTCTAN